MAQISTETHIRPEIVQLHETIRDEDIINIISCPGVQKSFYTETLNFGDYNGKINPITQARYIEKEGTITDAHGNVHRVAIQRDASAVAASIYAVDSNQPVVRVVLRDRQHDGTQEASPVHYLRTINGLQDHEIPSRSHELGVVDWYYSGPQDVTINGTRSVELSVSSSDPNLSIHEPLRRKADEGKLWTDPKSLAAFIKDPFAALDQQTLNDWYKHWWQVVNRALHGNEVPLPGQTAKGAYDQFLEHVVTISSETLRSHGYTHLSAVPTWSYVWEKFQRLGFQPDHPDIHAQAEEFLALLQDLEIPHPTKQGESIYVNNFIQKRALIAWLAVLPFAIQMNPEFTPQPDVPAPLAEGFQRAFHTIRNAVVNNNQVKTYPLAPGKNLWYSLAL